MNTAILSVGDRVMVIGPTHGVLLFWGTLEGWDVISNETEIPFRRCRIRGDQGNLVTHYAEQNVYPYDAEVAEKAAMRPGKN